MSRAKIQVHREGTPHPTEHSFEELLRRIVSVPREKLDKIGSRVDTKRARQKAKRNGK